MPESIKPIKSAETADSANGKSAQPRWLRRIGWMLLIWSASVAALGAVAWGLKLVMRLIGMTT